MKRYNSTLCDPLIYRYHAQKFTLYGIREKMAEDGYPFSASTIHTAMRKLGLKPHRNTAPIGAGQSYLPKDKANPVTAAFTHLGKRLEVRDGGFWLDRVPTSLKDVVRATNAVLRASGMEEVGPQHWR